MVVDIARGRQILFVGGKGGTGKTSLSSAIAYARADAGQRVLLVSTDPAHSLGHVWDRQLTDTPSRIVTTGDGYIDAVEVDPDATVERHFAAVEKTMYRMLPERQHSAIREHLNTARSAPGSQEAATLERIAQIIEFGLADYDAVVFDTAPTGTTMHLLALPERLTNWMQTLLANRDRSDRFAAAARGLVGKTEETSSADAELRRNLLARRDRFALMRRTVQDASVSGFIIATLAEKLPVAETLEMAGQLDRLGIDIASVVVNRRSPADAGPLLAQRRAHEEEYVRQLRAGLGDVPLTQVPLLAREISGTDSIGELAGLLGPGARA